MGKGKDDFTTHVHCEGASGRKRCCRRQGLIKKGNDGGNDHGVNDDEDDWIHDSDG